MDKKLIDEWKKLNNVLIGTTKGGRNNQNINFYADGRTVPVKCFGDVAAGDAIALRTTDGQWYVYANANIAVKFNNVSFYKQIIYRKTKQNKKIEFEFLRASYSQTIIVYPFSSNSFFVGKLPKDTIEDYMNPEQFDFAENAGSGSAREMFTPDDPFYGTSIQERSEDRKTLLIENNLGYEEENQNFNKTVSTSTECIFVFKNLEESEAIVEIQYEVLSNYNTLISAFDGSRVIEQFIHPANNSLRGTVKFSLGKNQGVVLDESETYIRCRCVLGFFYLGQLTNLVASVKTVEISVELE